MKPDRPYWLYVLGILAVWLGWFVIDNQLYRQIFFAISSGIGITLFVTFVAFFFASLLGLIIALMGLSRRRTIRQIARFYVEVIRGIPVLVMLLYVAFAAAPAFVSLLNATVESFVDLEEGRKIFHVRDISLLWRAIVALVICYSAFIAEVFRAGIESVDQGQIDAGKALGLSGWLRFRLLIWPQAVRTVLPALGNDFVAMIKDSSLVAVLGVQDITQLGKVYAAGSFRYFETYSIIAYVYLLITVGLSLGVRRLESYLHRSGVRDFARD